MFETMTLFQLQQYWWAIASLLGGILVFLMFVQGGQTLMGSVTKTEEERNLVANSLGRKWHFTFTTLVTFGGAMFAAFPLFYATSFGGAYWVWMLILFCFIIQAVSYEFRRKPKNFLGTRTYDTFLFINGSLGVLLLGTAVATFFTGSQFSISDYHLSKWENSLRGIEAAFNFDNLSLGIAVLFLSRLLGSLYLINSMSDTNILQRLFRQLKINTALFLVFFLFFVFRLLSMDGFTYQPVTKFVSMEHYKYLQNFLAMPAVLSVFLAGVAGVLTEVYLGIFHKSRKGIWFAGAGTIMTVFALLVVAGFHQTCFYPSTFDLQSSLTIENASSSRYTLITMSYVSLLIPVVLAYIFYAWRSMDRKRIDTGELNNEDHSY
jgi:cytochrome bd ubiquinol oxidase subunit II